MVETSKLSQQKIVRVLMPNPVESSYFCSTSMSLSPFSGPDPETRGARQVGNLPCATPRPAAAERQTQPRRIRTAAEPPSPPVKEVRKYCGFPHRHHFLMQRWTCCSNFNDNFGTTLQLHVLIVKTRAAASNFLFVWVVSCISDKPLEV